MWQFIAKLVLRNKFIILGIITLLTVFFGYQAATGLQLDNKYGVLLPKEDDAKVAYMDFKERFGEDGNTLVIGIQSDKLYTEENFLKWKEMGDSILKFDGVLSVFSEANLFLVENNQEKMRFEINKIFADTRFEEKSIEQVKEESRRVPFFEGFLYNPETNVSLMMVRIDEDFLSDKKKNQVVLDIEHYTEQFKENFGEIHVSGLPHIRIVIGKRIMSEMFLFIGLSVLVTSILIFLFFRSFRVVLICLSVVGVAVVWSMGMIATFHFKISILTALIPPLMIVIGIPNCVYLMTKFHQEFRASKNKIRALTRVMRKVGVATFLTNLTTSFGFMTLIFTNSDKLMEFGLVSSINIMMIFVLSFTILPIIVSLTDAPEQRHLAHLDRNLAVNFLNTLVRIVVEKRKWVYGTSILAVLVSLWGISRINITGQLTGDLPEGHQILRDVHFFEDHLGGSIPFEVLVNYKEKGRLFKTATLQRVEALQNRIGEDADFSKSMSLVDVIKVINMAYYGNDVSRYEIFNKRDMGRLKQYIDNFDLNNMSASIQMKELLDTTNTTLRVRMQMKDLGSYEVTSKVEELTHAFDSILNPTRGEMEAYYDKIIAGRTDVIDSLLTEFPEVYNKVASSIANGNNELQLAFDSDEESLKKFYKNDDFNNQLRKAIDNQYYDVTFTGTSVVAAIGTQFLVSNLLSSIAIAIVAIAFLMALLFRSWRMVLISLIPNLIPMITTGGIMGWMGIPLKPSTLLVFSIAFGITVDDTIHYLAKYKQELKSGKWSLEESIIHALREAGLGMFYTSLILFCGFGVFAFSQFGGTQALGMLISLTLLVAMCTNLIVLPSLLMSWRHKLSKEKEKKSFFAGYDEADVETDEDMLVIEEHAEEVSPSQEGIE